MTLRANMPEISAAAHNTLSEHPGYIKQHVSQKHKVIETCKTCNKQYDQVEADQVISKDTILVDFNYANLCLSCIKEHLQAIKALKHPELKESRKSLDELTILYQKSLKEWRDLSQEYQELDYQEKMIHHHLSKPVKVPKEAKSKKTKTAEQIKKATALKILGNLTKEQQAAIMLLMK